MRWLDGDSLRQALPMLEAIDAMEEAFGDDRETPLRQLLGSSLFMPGKVGSHTGMKVVSIVPGQPSGIVVAFGRDGKPLGIVDGPTLTAIRTAAGCGLATRLLARPGASTMAMLGAGAMAWDQIAAVKAVRPIERTLVWSRSGGTARALAEAIGGEWVEFADEAVADADIVTCATPSSVPLFAANSISPGTHINAVGAFTPDMVEVPAKFVLDSFVVVDDLDASAAEAGDLIQARRVPDATMGDLLTGRIEAPVGSTLFKSVGIASQDVAAAVRGLNRATEFDLGFPFS